MQLFPSINPAVFQKFWIFWALSVQTWEASTIPSCHLLSPHVLTESAYSFFEQISNALLFPCSLRFRVFRCLVIFTRMYSLPSHWGSDKLGLSELINSKKSFICGSSSINIFHKFLWLNHSQYIKIKETSKLLLLQILSHSSDTLYDERVDDKEKKSVLITLCPAMNLNCTAYSTMVFGSRACWPVFWLE